MSVEAAEGDRRGDGDCARAGGVTAAAPGDPGGVTAAAPGDPGGMAAEASSRSGGVAGPAAPGGGLG